jgi:hypothetical protein
MNIIGELPHVLAIINAATIVVLLQLTAIRARDREDTAHNVRRHRPRRCFSLCILCITPRAQQIWRLWRSADLFPRCSSTCSWPCRGCSCGDLHNALKQRFATHKRLARFTFPAWLFVAISGLVVYVMAIHLYPMSSS